MVTGRLAEPEPHAEKIRAWLDDEDLTVVKVHTLLARRGVTVPVRTLERFCAGLPGPEGARGRRSEWATASPGRAAVDFGRIGLLFDSETERRRVCHALIFTPCVSRYSFVWLCFSQTMADVIDGCEAAWAVCGRMFRTVIPDNMSPIVDKANSLDPRLNCAFVEYAL